MYAEETFGHIKSNNARNSYLKYFIIYYFNELLKLNVKNL